MFHKAETTTAFLIILRQKAFEVTQIEFAEKLTPFLQLSSPDFD
jgi:hypothetical protein